MKSYDPTQELPRVFGDLARCFDAQFHEIKSIGHFDDITAAYMYREVAEAIINHRLSSRQLNLPDGAAVVHAGYLCAHEAATKNDKVDIASFAGRRLRKRYISSSEILLEDVAGESRSIESDPVDALRSELEGVDTFPALLSSLKDIQAASRSKSSIANRVKKLSKALKRSTGLFEDLLGRIREFSAARGLYVCVREKFDLPAWDEVIGEIEGRGLSERMLLKALAEALGDTAWEASGAVALESLLPVAAFQAAFIELIHDVRRADDELNYVKLQTHCRRHLGLCQALWKKPFLRQTTTLAQLRGFFNGRPATLLMECAAGRSLLRLLEVFRGCESTRIASQRILT
ncbi:hypothetical protein LAZ29_01445 [Cereibacter sphaeroides]|uniref:hypothetical protein n=1 Tax=Cereibacter sphaeroides TaxID=1063 RepID=UPI001F37BD42|nr:hypothetical protein [Cereibacter sphaeroides]MCE6949602.1 hypothetical protein [Cereibacter sphaeroides]